ncbi:MAG: hypothetical protein ABI456_23405 [Ktedonobacteraceae bacterium]
MGFNVVAGLKTQEEFWTSLREIGQQAFLDALDYIGLDSYPDVFFPVELTDLPAMLVKMLSITRTIHLAAAGIAPSVPLHIAENGWATGPERSYERQAEVLETIIRTIYAQQDAFHVTHYELFMLRDVESSNLAPFFQFGILRDDYIPKPAFERYRRLIAELGTCVNGS